VATLVIGLDVYDFAIAERVKRELEAKLPGVDVVVVTGATCMAVL